MTVCFVRLPRFLFVCLLFLYAFPLKVYIVNATMLIALDAQRAHVIYGFYFFSLGLSLSRFLLDEENHVKLVNYDED